MNYYLLTLEKRDTQHRTSKQIRVLIDEKAAASSQGAELVAFEAKKLHMALLYLEEVPKKDIAP